MYRLNFIFLLFLSVLSCLSLISCNECAPVPNTGQDVLVYFLNKQAPRTAVDTFFYRVNAPNNTQLYPQRTDTLIKQSVYRLPLQKTKTSTAFSFYYDTLQTQKDTIVFEYNIRTSVATPNCGIYTLINNLKVTASSFDSVVVIKEELTNKDSVIYVQIFY
jgi:hypothetical protein